MLKDHAERADELVRRIIALAAHLDDDQARLLLDDDPLVQPNECDDHVQHRNLNDYNRINVLWPIISAKSETDR